MPQRISILLLLLLSGSLAQAQTFLFSGRVLDKLDTTAIAQVNINVRGTDVGTSSDAEGRFALQVNHGDTIDITSVQHQPVSLLAFMSESGEEVTILLEPIVYELEEVTIDGFSKDYIKYKILNPDYVYDPHAIDLNMPSTEDIMNPDMDDYDSAPYPGAGPAGGGGGIGLNWDKNEKHRKWQNDELRKWMNDEETVHKRLVPEYVARLIPLTDEQLEGFLKFCGQDMTQALELTEYDFAVVVKECYEAYLVHQQEEVH